MLPPGHALLDAAALVAVASCDLASWRNRTVRRARFAASLSGGSAASLRCVGVREPHCRAVHI